MTMHNVDDILHDRSAEISVRQAENQPKSEPDVEVENSSPDEPVEVNTDSESEEKLTHIDQFRKDKEEFLEKKEDDSIENMQSSSETHKNKENKSENSSEFDEYGNQVAKKKMYTEEEVNQKIRDRLSRGKFAQEHQQQQVNQHVQQATSDFKADPESNESWETQLESFVVNTFSKMQQQQQQQAWQQQEQAIQADFETRFSTGMERFQDFKDVLSDKPITNSMMMATRSMKDPASFIYAAAKQQPKELNRIANIVDPYQQAAEMGRLEERMRKARNVSSAPKPSVKVKSDVGSNYDETPSIDSRIMSDAKRKFRGAK